MKKALSFFFIFAALQLLTSFAAAGVAAVLHFDAQQVWVHIASLFISSVITGALFLRLGWCKVSPHYLRTRPWGVMSWSVLAAIGAILPSMWIQEQMPPLPNVLDESFNMILHNS